MNSYGFRWCLQASPLSATSSLCAAKQPWSVSTSNLASLFQVEHFAAIHQSFLLLLISRFSTSSISVSSTEETFHCIWAWDKAKASRIISGTVGPVVASRIISSCICLPDRVHPLMDSTHCLLVACHCYFTWCPQLPSETLPPTALFLRDAVFLSV